MYIPYRTRKYIRKTLFYVSSTTVFFLLSVWLAHNNQLPAVFEKYAGPGVRSSTLGIYQGVFGTQKPDQKVVKSSSWGAYISAFRDFILREPGYLSAKEAIHRIEDQLEIISVNNHRNEFLHELKSDPAIIQWLRSPKGRFSQIFLFEIKRKLDTSPFIKSFFLIDKENKIVFNFDKTRKDVKFLIKPNLPKGLSTQGFSVEIKDGDTVLGAVLGEWDPWFFPDIPLGSAAATGMSLLILDDSNNIRNGTPEGLPAQLFTASPEFSAKFMGPRNGTFGNYRFISSYKNPYTMVVAFPGAGTGFYIFRILVYSLVLISIFITYIMGRKAYLWMQETRYTPKSVWLNAELQSSVNLNASALHLAQESQTLTSQLKEKELERLELIAMRISDLASRKPLESRNFHDSREIRENIIKKEAYISPAAEIPEILTQDIIAEEVVAPPKQESKEHDTSPEFEKTRLSSTPALIPLQKQTIPIPISEAELPLTEKEVNPAKALKEMGKAELNAMPPAILLDRSEGENVQVIDELDSPATKMLLADDDTVVDYNKADEITEKTHLTPFVTPLHVEDEPGGSAISRSEKSVASTRAIINEKPSAPVYRKESPMLQEGYIPDEDLENFELDFSDELSAEPAHAIPAVDQTLIRNFKYKAIHETVPLIDGREAKDVLFLEEDLNDKFLTVA